jgi:putative transposase
VRAAMRCNNRVEQAHQSTRVRERRMGRFRCPVSAQRFFSAFARVSNLFRPGRHRLKAHEWRSTLQVSFTTWQGVVGLSVS